LIKQLHQIDLHMGRITKPRWSPNGRLIALPTESGSIAIFDISSGEVAQKLGPHSAAVTCVCWDRESELVMSCSLDHSVGVWDLDTGKRALFNPGGHKEPVHSVEWTDEGAYALTCSADRVRAWDGFCLQAGWTEQMENMANQTTAFTAASCSFQTTLMFATAAENGLLLLLANLVSADLLGSVRLQEPVRSLAWSPAEELLAAGASQSIIVFHAGFTGFQETPRKFATDAANVEALTFSPNGALLASRDSNGLKIWDVKTGSLTVALDEKTDLFSTPGVSSGIAFHPRKPLLAAVTPDGNGFRIFDVSNLI
jgi:WD40 repeat protein